MLIPKTLPAGIAGLAACMWIALIDGCGDSPWLRLQPAPSTSAQWDLFETTGTLDFVPDNPFDPTQVDLAGEFEAPDGTRFVANGFWYQGYLRELQQGKEALSANGEPSWKVRFSPHQEGTWHWRWKFKTPNHAEESPWRSLRVSAPSPDVHGFLRVSDLDRRYLRQDDGSPYFAVGENVGWYDDRGSFAYDDWFSKLGAQGANYARLWMAAWSFGLEGISRNPDGSIASSTLGNYTTRLDRAWQLDQVLQQARQNGIRIMLCLQNHGAFSLHFNSEWLDNPYNQDNGGPLLVPEDFFTDAAVQELFKQKLRYVVARYGYSPNILAWELWNEVDLTEQRDPEVLAQWHATMAAELKRLDPHRHLVTTSTASLAQLLGIDAALYALADIDLAQVHQYGTEGNDIDFSAQTAQWAGYFAQFQKPGLLGEMGVDFRGPQETLWRDPSFSGFHDILWTGLFAQTFGSGMNWWWDNVVDPNNLYPHFGPLGAFTEGILLDEEGFVPLIAEVQAPGRDLLTLSLGGRRTVLAWIKNRDNRWFLGIDEQPVEQARLDVNGLANGEWQVRWINTYGEASPPGSRVTVEAGSLTLAVPTFARDLALRMDRVLE